MLLAVNQGGLWTDNEHVADRFPLHEEAALAAKRFGGRVVPYTHGVHLLGGPSWRIPGSSSAPAT